MPGKVIGQTLNHGFAGSYARHPDMLIMTRPNGSAENIVFGTALEVAPGGKVIPATATITAATFAGVAGKEIKTQLNYLDQNAGGVYAPNETVSVFQRGSINVLCPNDSPAANGPVYIRISVDGAKQIGDFEAVSITGENVLIPNAQWGGVKDINNVAELVLLYRVNA